MSLSKSFAPFPAPIDAVVPYNEYHRLPVRRAEHMLPRDGQNHHEGIREWFRRGEVVYVGYFDDAAKRRCNDPYARKLRFAVKCFSIELRKGHPELVVPALQRIIDFVCQNQPNSDLRFNVVGFEEVPGDETQFYAYVATRCLDATALFELVNEHIVCDRHGFWSVPVSERERLREYCAHLHDLPMQERHWKLDGLPWNRLAFAADITPVKRRIAQRQH